jgi:predicted ATP-binding protein involved in virulence
MRKSQNNPLVYFTSLELESVRCFGHPPKLDLTDGKGNPARWTLLLGDNGVGKTTLLQCLSWMRPVFEKSGYEGPTPLRKGQLGPALQQEENEILEGLLRSGKAVELRLASELSFNKALVSPKGTKKTRSRASRRKIKTSIQLWYTTKKELREYETHGTKIQKRESFVEPLIVTYGANRHMGRQNLDVSNLEDPIAARLSDLTELYDAEEILSKLDHAAAKKRYRGIENRRLEKIKEILARILPDIEKSSDIKILAPKIATDSLILSGVRFKTFSGLVPLSALSLGYQTTLAWTVDLAWRLFQHYTKSRNPLAEPAIVIIDEIDLHLHPLWQRTIMDDLSRLFPRTQFIATAHSPLMVQSAPDANLAVLHKIKDEVIIENDPEVVRSWRVDQILNSELFGLPTSRDAKTELLFRERARLLDKIRRNRSEQARLRHLERQLALVPTASDKRDQRAMDLIRKAATILKRREGLVA